MAETSFEQLRLEFQSSDPEVLNIAINNLIERYQDQLRRIIERALLHPIDPAQSTQDLSQRIWLKLNAYIRAGNFRLETEVGFVSLLKRMARQTIIDSVKPGRPKNVPIGPAGADSNNGNSGKRIDVPDPGSGPLTKAMKKEIIDKIRQDVTPRQWRYISRRFLDDMSWPELAKEDLTVEGCPPPGDEAIRKKESSIRISLLDRLFPKLVKKHPEFAVLIGDKN
jgi:RNA polymerase sigma factor (sigma-70 family)